MAGRYVFPGVLLAALFFACSPQQEKPTETKKAPPPVVVLKSKPRLLSETERVELGFSPEVITQVEAASGSQAVPFFEPVMMPSENLKGDVMITRERLAGFSVRTTKAEKIIAELSGPLRGQGYLVFRSELNYGSVPDVVTVIRGKSSYDILSIQKTEAPNYNLDTKAIVSWLKAQQKRCSFVVTGAGADWVEARFLKRPGDMDAFAHEVYAFAPDVVGQGTGTVKKLAEQMDRANGFYLWWD